VGKISSSHGKRSLKKNGVYLTVKSPTSEKAENLILLKELIEAGKLRVANAVRRFRLWVGNWVYNFEGRNR